MTWQIVRRDSSGDIPGRARTVFRDASHGQHIVKLQAYADGLVSYTNTVGYDVRDFRMLAQRGDIRVVPHNFFFFEDRLSGLGSCSVEMFKPRITRDELIGWVERTIQSLDPAGTGLLDFDGVAFDPVDAARPVNERRMPMRSRPATFVRTNDAGKIMRGQPLGIILREGDGWTFTDWMIYADGASQFGPDGPMLAFDKAVEQARAGRVKASLPPGEWLNMDGLGDLLPKNPCWWVDSEDLIAEAEDIFGRVRGQEGCQAFCLRTLAYYKQNPGPEAVEMLQYAYDCVPAHMRMIGLDDKENTIREALNLPPVLTQWDYGGIPPAR